MKSTVARFGGDCLLISISVGNREAMRVIVRHRSITKVPRRGVQDRSRCRAATRLRLLDFAARQDESAGGWIASAAARSILSVEKVSLCWRMQATQRLLRV